MRNAMVEDRRERTGTPWGYVVCTDTFLSGWGYAPSRSLYALAIYPGEDPDVVMQNAECRTDMRRPRIVTRLKADGTPKVRLYPGDHLAVVDSATAERWYVPGGFR